MDSQFAEQQMLDELRAGRANGQPGPHLVNLCIALDTGLPLASDDLAEVIRQGARVDVGVSAVASLPHDAVGLAIYEGDGVLVAANALFDRCVADTGGSEALSELLHRAQVHGRAVGLVPAIDEGLVCVLAVALTLAGRWPILKPLAEAIDANPRGIAVIVLSPSRSDAAFARTAFAAGLSGLETRVAQALLQAETLEDAANALGVKRETAKTAIANAARRVGVNTCAELVGLLVDVSCATVGQSAGEAEVLKRLFGLTPTEARVAIALLAERSLKHTALALQLAPETVKAHQRAIFAKTHSRRSRTFRRLALEALALDAATPFSEILATDPEQVQGLKFLFREDGRRLGFVDYGPKRAAPLFVGHGDFTGRILPAPLVKCLQQRGFRPIALQRPGFGLTADAEEGAFLATAASDMAFVLDALKAEVGHLFMRDGGAAAALAFAEIYPSRVGQALLQNPRQPNDFQTRGANPLGSLQQFLRSQPELLRPVSEMMRRQNSPDTIRAILRHLAAAVPADGTLIADESVVDFLVTDVHGLGPPGNGFEAERRLYSDGWTPGNGPFGGRWTVFTSKALFPDFDVRPWACLPSMRFAPIADAGTFVQFTHPEEIAELLTPV